MPDTPISKPQLKRLQTLWGLIWGRFGTPEGDKRAGRLAWLTAKLGREVESAKELTKAEAKLALEEMAKCLPAELLYRRRGAWRAAGTAGRKGARWRGGEAVLVSRQSLELLGTLKTALGWNDDRLAAFVRRQLRGRQAIRTEADANKVIWGMKRMARAESGPQPRPGGQAGTAVPHEPHEVHP